MRNSIEAGVDDQASQDSPAEPAGSDATIDVCFPDADKTRFLSGALREISNGVVITDVRGRILWTNPAFTQKTGYSAAEVRGRNPRLLKSGCQNKAFYEKLWNKLLSGQTWHGEFVNRKKNGTLYNALTTITPVRGVGEELTHFVAVMDDITAARGAEEELKTSREMLKQIIDYSPAVIYRLRLSGGILTPHYISENLTRLLGFTPEEALRPNWWGQQMHPQDRKMGMNYFQGTVERGGGWLEYRLRHKDGHYRWVEDNHRALKGSDGEITELVGTWTDITERRQTQHALHESERRFREMMANVALIAITLDATGKITSCNGFLLRLTGWRRDEVIGENWFQKFIPPTEERVKKLFFEGLRTGSMPTSYENPITKRDGELRDIVWNNTLLRDECGNAVGIASIGQDVTDERASRQQISDALNFRQTILEASPLGIITYNAVGDAVTVTSGAARLIGATTAQLRMQNFRTISSWRAAGLLELAEKALRTGVEQGIETEMSTSFGKEVWLDWRFIPFQHEGETHLLAMFSDIGDRKRADLARAESEQRFRQLAENISEVFWMTDITKGQMLYVSPGYELIWGQTCKSLYLSPHGWSAAIHPDDRERVEHAAHSKQISGEYDETYRIIRPDGSSRWVHDRAFPIKNEKGEVYRIVGTAEDITSQRTLEAQLRQAQKLEAIGQLAAGVAHDFNNVLTVINGYSELMIQTPDMPPCTMEMIKQIAEATERAGNLTRQLLTFSRKQSARMEPLNLNTVLIDVAKMLRRLIGENIALHLSEGSNLPLIVADPGMIEQILMNLSVNARDAMGERGELWVATEGLSLNEQEASQWADGKAGEFVRLSVIDIGSGIAPEHMSRIFEPFFTTKAEGKGTGLGLATVFGIAKQHGGWVTVESKVGKGTTFRVYFPVASEMAVKRPVASSVAPLPRGNETILLVEDEDPLRKLVHIVLRRLGYTVLEAEDGDQALRVWTEHEGQIDLLLTDIVMPGSMTGRQLADQLRKTEPDLPVIYCSGYNPEAPGQSVVHGDPAPLLAKPYPQHKLATFLRKCLDGRAQVESEGKPAQN